MIRKLSTLAVIPFFLAACEPRDDDAAVFDDTQVAEERAHEVGDTETLNLSDVDNSGVSGDVRFTVMSQNETTAMVEVADARPNTTYQVAIHQGQCDAVGQQRHELETIQTNAQGDGASTTTLNTRLVNLMDGNHVVALHGERADYDRTDRPMDPTTDTRTDAPGTTPDTRTDADRDDMTTQTGVDRPVACGEISEHGTGLGW